jgi:hypothetical protein
MMADLRLDVQALEQVVADCRARRELLWLRARKNGDEATVSDLKRIDPGVDERIQAFHGDINDDTDFDRLYDACLERHLRRVVSLGTQSKAKNR